MVFGWLFGKKKANEPQAAQQPQAQQMQQAPTQAPAATAPQKQKAPKQPTQQREDAWIYEYLLQYLTSPLWKVPIYDFLDENCIVFDDEEENKFSYTQIHKKFKVMVESMVETLMSEIGVDEETMLYYIEIGLKSNTHKKVFEQLLIVDNFLVFKKLMVKRNKELELEALKELMKDEGQSTEPQNSEKIKIATLQAERAEIDHAIQASMAADEQLKKMQEAEEEDLQRVLEMSKISFQSEEQTRSKLIADEQQKQEQQRQEQEAKAAAVAAAAQQKPVPVEVKQVEKPSPVKKVVEPEEQKEMPVFKPLQKLPVLKPLSSLPPLIEKKYEKPVEDLLQDRMALMKQLDSYKAAEDKIKNEKKPEKPVEEEPSEQKESLEERKQRLLAQRELLRKKKMQQREKELTEYKETGDNSKKGIDSQQSILLSENTNSANTENLSAAELQKRQALMSKIKQNM